MKRKLVHVAVFTGAVPVYLILGFWGVVVYGALVSLSILQAVWRGEASPFYRILARTTEARENRRNSILVPVVATALGGLTAVLLVGDFAVVGFLACGWGDAAGEVVGGCFGRHAYRVPGPRGGSRRTVEGSVAVALVGALGCSVAMCLLGYGALSALPAAFLAALAATLGEAVSPGNADNFWTQVLPSLVGWWLLG